ncbi:hypothetical protein NIES4102_30250 [Chondrocystis sp. NIES-4102]|nr:hypothetical protein NIES4102_30250 [Chondrocystis sp. NIES-4102]
MESPLNCTSANFEQVALAKLRSLTAFLPADLNIKREAWGSSTALCIDFANCPHIVNLDKDQTNILSAAIAKLGLANSIIFRIGSKTVGWTNIKV